MPDWWLETAYDEPNSLVSYLLVATGLLQRTSASLPVGEKRQPTLSDSLLVGAVQGLAILPGISRSGVTASALLVRRYEPPEAFRLSVRFACLGLAALAVCGGTVAVLL